MRLSRVRTPAWVIDGEGSSEEREAQRDATGEQIEWGFAIPMIYRALASPHTHEPIVAPPQRGHEFHVAARGYWTALLHLLTYSFGWMRPERGLHWWDSNGNPTDDLRFELISEVWQADGMLGWFHAWLYTRAPGSDGSTIIEELTGYRDADVNDEARQRNPGWVDDRIDQADASGVPAPVGHGGWDPLHLSVHNSGPLEPAPPGVTLIHSSSAERRAVLVADSMVGWYRALADHGSALPSLGDRSWHVDVFARPVGHLGTFRRSRDTGIWFAGPHRYHLVGNEPE